MLIKPAIERSDILLSSSVVASTYDMCARAFEAGWAESKPGGMLLSLSLWGLAQYR